jgi:type VI secretion system protein ImpK
MARSGEYQSAERLLLSLSPTASPRVFDLMARIYAQQGRYADAELQWKQAIRQQPENETYQRGLRAAQRYHFGSWLRFRWAVAMLVIACATLGIAIWRLHHHAISKNVIENVPPIPIGTPIPGIDKPPRTTRFKAPIFSVGTRFTDAGKNEIRHFAQQQLNRESRIEIEGQTDSQIVRSGSKYQDNEELGLARATAVALFLHREAAVPLNRIAVLSRPNTDSERPLDASQRTVVIRFRSGR